MKRFSIRDARARLADLIDAAKCSPIALTRRGRTVAVMISPEDFDDFADFRAATKRARLRAEFEDRLSPQERQDPVFLDQLSKKLARS